MIVRLEKAVARFRAARLSVVRGSEKEDLQGEEGEVVLESAALDTDFGARARNWKIRGTLITRRQERASERGLGDRPRSEGALREIAALQKMHLPVTVAAVMAVAILPSLAHTAMFDSPRSKRSGGRSEGAEESRRPIGVALLR